MVDDKELVSIIIPFYNAEKYVDRCVEAIKAQTYDMFEVIFVDDGSTDNSCEKITNICDSRVKLYKQEKKGVSAARNLGIEKANGIYIGFWDIDDFPHSNYIERFVNCMKTYNVDVAICNYSAVYPKRKNVNHILPWKNVVIGRDEIQNELIPRMICAIKGESPVRGLVWRTFATKEVIIKNDLMFEPSVSIAEDLLFTVKLYNRVSKMYVLEDVLYEYYMSSNSTLNSYRKDAYEKNQKYHQIYEDILKQEKLYEKNELRYYTKKVAGYSYLISNFIRSNDRSIIKAGVKKIIAEFAKEKIDYKKCYLDSKYKMACFLISHKMEHLLIIIYTLKEKIRLRKLF